MTDPVFRAIAARRSYLEALKYSSRGEDQADYAEGEKVCAELAAFRGLLKPLSEADTTILAFVGLKSRLVAHAVE